MKAVLEARDIVYAYGRTPVLRQASLRVEPGELVALLGVNGAGKSTLLRLLLGFERPQGGSVTLSGRTLSSYGRRELAGRIAYVPQAHSAPFPYSVKDVVLLGRIAKRGYLRQPDDADRLVCDKAIAQLGIERLAARPYTTLSGGERQLTLIARALAQEARVLIFDEPSSALDYGNQLRLLARLRALADEGYAVLFTTHHPEHVFRAADRVALLIDGRIEADGAPAGVLSPAMFKRLYGVEIGFMSPASHGAMFGPTPETQAGEACHV